MIHVYDFTELELVSAWTPAWGRLLAMVQGNWDDNVIAKIWLQIRMREEDVSRTPITRVGIDLDIASHSIHSPAFTLAIASDGTDRASAFFACDALDGCHYDFRWAHNGEIVDGNQVLQGIVKTGEIPSYLR